MPDFWKKQECVSGFDGGGEMGPRFEGSTAAGNIVESESVKNASVLPVKRETFWMTLWRIVRVGRNARFAGSGDVKAPILIAAAHRKIAVEGTGSGLHTMTG